MAALAPPVAARRPLQELVHDKVAQAFAAGSLSIDSDIQRIPFIGSWLAATVAEQVTGSPARATLRELLAYLTRPGDDSGAGTTRPELIAGRVSLLCQNRHPNACVPSRRRTPEAHDRYYVRDSNKACSFAIPMALLRALGRGDPDLPLAEGAPVVHGLQAAMVRVQSRATQDGASAAAGCPCEQREGCVERAGLCTWLPGAVDGEGECVPADNTTPGFEGILPFTGQKESRTQHPGLHVRGDYGSMREGGTRWRRPAVLGRVSAGAQALAWTISPRPAAPAHALSDAAFAQLVRATSDHAAAARRIEDLIPLLRRDPGLNDPMLRTTDGALTPAARAALPAAVGAVSERHLHHAYQESPQHRTRADFVEHLPLLVREEVRRRLSQRVQADARPDWKRGLDTRTRSQLKAAARHHPALRGDALITAVTNDASVGDRARQSADGPLTQAAARYVSESRRAR